MRSGASVGGGHLFDSEHFKQLPDFLGVIDRHYKLTLDGQQDVPQLFKILTVEDVFAVIVFAAVIWGVDVKESVRFVEAGD